MVGWGPADWEQTAGWLQDGWEQRDGWELDGWQQQVDRHLLRHRARLPLLRRLVRVRVIRNGEA